MNDFSFSQSSLQDFVDCPRRFELRYLRKIRWPGSFLNEPEEIQNSIVLGNRFHLLCQQYFSGIPEDLIHHSIEDETLLEWWNNFTAWKNEELLDGQFYPEITCSTHINHRPVIAKFDLIHVHSTGIRIYDWKTSPTRYSKSWLEKKIQTTLYPLVLCMAGQNFTNDHRLPAPENIEMVYWFANHPQDPEIFVYSRYQLDEDSQSISELIENIKNIPPGKFEMTTDQRHCRYCTYSSFCDRYPDDNLQEADDKSSLESAMENLAAVLENQLDEITETWLKP